MSAASPSHFSRMISTQPDADTLLAMLFGQQDNLFPADTALYQLEVAPELDIKGLWVFGEPVSEAARQRYQLPEQTDLALWITDRDELVVTLMDINHKDRFQAAGQQLQIVKVDTLPQGSWKLFMRVEMLLSEVIDPHLIHHKVCGVRIFYFLLSQRDQLLMAGMDEYTQDERLLEEIEYTLAVLQKQHSAKYSQLQRNPHNERLVASLLSKLLLPLDTQKLISMLMGQQQRLFSDEWQQAARQDQDFNTLASLSLFSIKVCKEPEFQALSLPDNCHFGVFVDPEGVVFAALYLMQPDGQKQFHSVPLKLLNLRSWSMRYLKHTQQHLDEQAEYDDEMTLHLFSILSLNYLNSYSRHCDIDCLSENGLNRYIDNRVLRVKRQLRSSLDSFPELTAIRDRLISEAGLDLAAIETELLTSSEILADQQNREDWVGVGELWFEVVPTKKIVNHDHRFAVINLNFSLLDQGQIRVGLVDRVDELSAVEWVQYSGFIDVLSTTPETIRLLRYIFNHLLVVYGFSNPAQSKLDLIILAFRQISALQDIAALDELQWLGNLRNFFKQQGIGLRKLTKKQILQASEA